MAQDPAITAPTGHTAFGNETTLWKWNVLCVSVCLTFTTIVFGLRTYVRAWMKREWLLEDFITTAAWIGFVVYCSLMTTVMSKHGGVHGWDLTKEQFQEATFWFNAASIAYGADMMVTKLGILEMYRRVFIPQRWSTFGILLRLFELVVLLFYIALTLVKIFECHPRDRIWNKSIAGTCIDIPELLNVSGIFNLVTDVLILLVPIKSVWNLKMEKKRKAQVVLCFTFGLIAPVFSTVGFVVRERVANSLDTTYNQPMILLWGAAEVCTALICLCLPPLTILLRKRVKTGPTQSILHGKSNNTIGSYHQGTNKRRTKFGLSDLGDEDLLAGDYVELDERAQYGRHVKQPGNAYMISVMGGHDSHTSTDVSREDLENTGTKIMKTVRVTQTVD